MFCVSLAHKYIIVPVIDSIPFAEIPHFSKRDIAYQTEDPGLREFYKYEVSLESFKEVIENRKGFKTDRALLKAVVEAQYDGKSMSAELSNSVELLHSENTFTVVTAHQPSLLTGPLYYIIKICSCISLCNRLKDEYPDYHFIPTFIMGGEDHDFEEIASLHFFNKTFTWVTEQKGSVGRMSLDGLVEVLESVKATFGTMSPHAKSLSEIIDQALRQSESYGSFMHIITHELFKETGLMTINMDNKELKLKLLPYIIQDIQEEASHKYVNQDQDKLSSKGFKPQAHAREVNIFYHSTDRERVIKTDDGYHIGELVMTKAELVEFLQKHPENISPNVVLRPIFQEIILPNLAYVGGGGELAYWMERTSLFDHWKIPFPMLIRRDSALIIDSKTTEKLKKYDLNIKDLFEREDLIAIKFAKEQSDAVLDFKSEKDQAAEVFKSIEKKVSAVDQTLLKAVKAEESKFQKVLDNLQNKLVKAEKRKNEVDINRIIKLKSQLFPNNDSLQERYENFIPYYLQYGNEFITEFIKSLNPLNKEFKIIQIEN